MVELTDGEMKNFGMVWALVIVSLSYCFILGKITPRGFIRLVALLPIISLFIALPLNLTSIHLCGFTAFLITWLANFKLLLFAFGEPPLCSDPPILFAHFLTVACLPISIQTSQKSIYGTNQDQEPQNKSYAPHKNLQKSQNNQNAYQKTPNKSYPSPKYLKNPSEKSLWNYIVKAIVVAIFLQIYDHSRQIPKMILWIIYFLHIFFVLEIVSALLAKLTKFFLGLHLEPQFNEPLLSTSLQDFWGRRWNLMVTSIMRRAVFQPIRGLTLRPLGPLLATHSAVTAGICCLSRHARAHVLLPWPCEAHIRSHMVLPPPGSLCLPRDYCQVLCGQEVAGPMVDLLSCYSGVGGGHCLLAVVAAIA